MNLTRHSDKITFINGYNLAKAIHNGEMGISRRWSLTEIKEILKKDHSEVYKEGVRTYLRENSYETLDLPEED